MSTNSDYLPHEWDRSPRTLRRLIEQGLVERLADGKVINRSRAQFAVRAIVALEFKVSRWTECLDQASRNRWFASQSYAVVPQKLRTVDRCRQAAELGVNVVWISDCSDYRLEVSQDPLIATAPPAWKVNDLLARYHGRYVGGHTMAGHKIPNAGWPS